jgi:hypothetical protein
MTTAERKPCIEATAPTRIVWGIGRQFYPHMAEYVKRHLGEALR